jgi:transcriptional regulator with XRE-family HTH domain
MLRELKTLNDTNIGEALKTLRIDRGMTLKDLSDKTNLSQSVLSRYERGKRMPTLTSFVALTRALDAEIFFAKK